MQCNAARLFGQFIIQINKFPLSLSLPTSIAFLLAATSVNLIGAQLLLAVSTAVTAASAAISTQWLFLPLTFQYGARKLTRYKMTPATGP